MGSVASAISTRQNTNRVVIFQPSSQQQVRKPIQYRRKKKWMFSKQELRRTVVWISFQSEPFRSVFRHQIGQRGTHRSRNWNVWLSWIFHNAVCHDKVIKDTVWKLFTGLCGQWHRIHRRRRIFDCSADWTTSVVSEDAQTGTRYVKNSSLFQFDSNTDQQQKTSLDDNCEENIR